MSKKWRYNCIMIAYLNSVMVSISDAHRAAHFHPAMRISIVQYGWDPVPSIHILCTASEAAAGCIDDLSIIICKQTI